VDISQILDALERERELLREFREISGQHLVLLYDENVRGMSKLLDARSDLMLELTAIETTLGTWITQLRNEPNITGEVLQELLLINNEIVQFANKIVELDEQAHWRLDLIWQKAANGSRRLNRSNEMLTSYTAPLPIQPNIEFNQ